MFSPHYCLRGAFEDTTTEKRIITTSNADSTVPQQEHDSNIGGNDVPMDWQSCREESTKSTYLSLNHWYEGCLNNIARDDAHITGAGETGHGRSHKQAATKTVWSPGTPAVIEVELSPLTQPWKQYDHQRSQIKFRPPDEGMLVPACDRGGCISAPRALNQKTHYASLC